jgi:hypothetical protein
MISGRPLSARRSPRGRAALSAAQMQLFRDWISNGAPNN